MGTSLRCTSSRCFSVTVLLTLLLPLHVSCSRPGRLLSHSQRKVRSAVERRVPSITMPEHPPIRENIGPTLKKFHPKISNTPNCW